MADTTDETTDAAPVAGARPTPSRAASAASRARRIGGGTTAPAPAPRPTPAPPGPRVRLTKDEQAPQSAPDEDAETPARTPAVAPGWLTWAPAAILTAGALAMAIVVAVVSHGVWWGSSAQDASRAALRDQVVAAAKECLAATNSYSYADIAGFEKAGAACTTGAFTAKFKSSVDSLIKPNAPKLKFVQKAQVNKAGIEAVSGGQWTVLLYGQLQITNVNQKTPRIDPFGADVRMEKSHGKWLISQLTLISSPVN